MNVLSNFIKQNRLIEIAWTFLINFLSHGLSFSIYLLIVHFYSLEFNSELYLLKNSAEFVASICMMGLQFSITTFILKKKPNLQYFKKLFIFIFKFTLLVFLIIFVLNNFIKYWIFSFYLNVFILAITNIYITLIRVSSISTTNSKTFNSLNILLNLLNFIFILIYVIYNESQEHFFIYYSFLQIIIMIFYFYIWNKNFNHKDNYKGYNLDIFNNFKKFTTQLYLNNLMNIGFIFLLLNYFSVNNIELFIPLTVMMLLYSGIANPVLSLLNNFHFYINKYFNYSYFNILLIILILILIYCSILFKLLPLVNYILSYFGFDYDFVNYFDSNNLLFCTCVLYIFYRLMPIFFYQNLNTKPILINNIIKYSIFILFLFLFPISNFYIFQLGFFINELIFCIPLVYLIYKNA